MNSFSRKPNRANESDLERLIEPLASYICATGRPKAALRSALEALFSEVEQTNRLATTRIAVLESRRLAASA